MLTKVADNGNLCASKESKKRFRDRIRSAFQGKTIELIAREVVNTRTGQQNRYYWGVIVPYVRDCLERNGYPGIKVSDTHEFLKSQFATKELVNTNTGEITSIPVSTKQMTLDDFSDYIENIRQFCIDNFGSPFPDANEQVRNTL